MPRRRLEADKSKRMLIETAVRLLMDRGAAKVTVAAVADDAGCAKGLVHYHFKNKRQLWEAVLDHLTTNRTAEWSGAFEGDSASDVVARTWELLIEESVNGSTLAWFSLVGPQSPLPEQTVSKAIDGFQSTIADSLGGLLARVGVRLRVPTPQVAVLLTSVLAGVGLQLVARGDSDRADLEDAYAVVWLGILSLET